MQIFFHGSHTTKKHKSHLKYHCQKTPDKIWHLYTNLYNKSIHSNKSILWYYKDRPMSMFLDPIMRMDIIKYISLIQLLEYVILGACSSDDFFLQFSFISMEYFNILPLFNHTSLINEFRGFYYYYCNKDSLEEELLEK